MLEHMVWDETERWQKPLKLQTRTPREAPSAGSGEWVVRGPQTSTIYPTAASPKPLRDRPWSRRPGGCRGAQTVPHERHTGHHGPSGGPSAAPHPPDALGQPAPTLRGFTAASAPSAPPSPRATRAPGRTPERRPIIRVETRRRPAGCSPATRRAPPPPPARTGEALTAASRCRVARRLRWQQCSRRRRRVSPSGARPRV